tara:strand:+ start:212 stop:913 length:702 start_codon:yes stop_codon:yes gene_type:complete
MKLIIENWRGYISEGEQSFQIYCDMDGVLVDFIKAAVNTINEDIVDVSIPSFKETGGITDLGRLRRVLERENRDLITAADIEIKGKEKIQKAANNYMYDRLKNDFEWWSTLDWMPDGQRLWDHIKQYNPYILTSPMDGEGSVEGKKAWVKEHLKLPNGEPPEKVILNSKKYLYATVGSTKNVLIDDMTKNITLWEKAEGIPIQHTSADDTIRQLDEIFRPLREDLYVLSRRIL